MDGRNSEDYIEKYNIELEAQKIGLGIVAKHIKKYVPINSI